MFEFEVIGSVRNSADAIALQLLALFKDSISEIQLDRREDFSIYFRPEYSHYFVVHTPLDIEYPEPGLEWTRRFCGHAGVSVVELIRTGSDRIYVKGLMAQNGSKVYAVLPFTHEFKTASAYALPFEDGSFETVFSFFMLHHLDEIPRGLKEIRRVLQDEGRFTATEPIGHHHGPNYSATDWERIFAEAGFKAEAEERDGALIIRAGKTGEKG